MKNSGWSLEELGDGGYQSRLRWNDHQWFRTRSSSSQWIKRRQRLHYSRSNQSGVIANGFASFVCDCRAASVSINAVPFTVPSPICVSGVMPRYRDVCVTMWWAVYCRCWSTVMLQHCCVSEENKEEENEYRIGSNLKCLMSIRFILILD